MFTICLFMLLLTFSVVQFAHVLRADFYSISTEIEDLITYAPFREQVNLANFQSLFLQGFEVSFVPTNDTIECSDVKVGIVLTSGDSFFNKQAENITTLQPKFIQSNPLDCFLDLSSDQAYLELIQAYKNEFPFYYNSTMEIKDPYSEYRIYFWMAFVNCTNQTINVTLGYQR